MFKERENSMQCCAKEKKIVFTSVQKEWSMQIQCAKKNGKQIAKEEKMCAVVCTGKEISA